MGKGWLMAVLSAVCLLAGAPAACALQWTPVTGTTSSIQEVAQVRGADGTLHVVWTRNTPGAATNDVLHVAVSPAGAVSAPTAVASAFAGIGNPAIVSLPGGVLETFFGAIQCTNSGCPEGLFSSTSSDGGRTWSAPVSLLDRDQAYGSDVNAATLSDGTSFETWSHTLGVTVHRGIDPATPDYDYQAAMNAGCCGYYSNLAGDGAGHMQLAWDSNATGFLGVWSQAVDPATGAPSGSALLMPGSVTSYQGTPSHDQMLSRTPITALPGHPGLFFIAYPAGYPSTTKVLLWRVGAAGSITVDEAAYEHNTVSVAADNAGRVWVFWSRGTFDDVHVYARRLSSAGLESPIDMGAPPGAQSIYALDGSVSPGGDPEALALVGLATGHPATYYARGPQTAAPPAPQNGKSVDVFRAFGTVTVKLPGQRSFTALSAGERIPVGSSVDTTHGGVVLEAARSAHGGLQRATFSSGAFVVAQRRGQALTRLKLAGGNPGICVRPAPDLATAARRLPHRLRRRLRGSGRGAYATSGSYAAATVHGTIWVTADYCDGTLVTVQRGTVSVFDLVRRRTVLVHAGRSYFARAR